MQETSAGTSLLAAWQDSQQLRLEELVGSETAGRLFSAVTGWRALPAEAARISDPAVRLEAAVLLERRHGATLSTNAREQLLVITGQAVRAYGKAAGLFGEGAVVAACIGLLQGSDGAPGPCHPRNRVGAIPYEETLQPRRERALPLVTDEALCGYLDTRLNTFRSFLNPQAQPMLPAARRVAADRLRAYAGQRGPRQDRKAELLARLLACAERPEAMGETLTPDRPASRSTGSDNVVYADFGGPRG